jgi:hypothetical protein
MKAKNSDNLQETSAQEPWIYGLLATGTDSLPRD